MQDNSSIIVINGLARKAGEAARNLLIGQMNKEWYTLALGKESTASYPEDQLIKECESMPFAQYYHATKVPNNVILKTESGIQIGFFNCKINVKKTNTIVCTAVQNRIGTVKEYISAKDYAITISGDLIAPRNEFPVEQLSALNKILSEPESLLVSSVYLESIFNISKLVMKDATFDQDKMKSLNVMPFTITFDSDNDNYNLED